MIAYTLLAWVLFGVGMAITGGSIDQAVALMAPGGGVRYVALAAIVILTVWLYVRSNRIAGLPSPVPAAPIAVALAAIALSAELLQSQLTDRAAARQRPSRRRRRGGDDHPARSGFAERQ